MAKNTLKTIGATNLAVDQERSKLDYYGTSPESTKTILQYEKMQGPVWEPAAGHHLMVDVLKEAGYTVKATDIADYGFGDEQLDFLAYEGKWDGAIFTNPPYGLATEFAVKALEIIQPGQKVIMFLRTLFLEGVKRYEKLFKENPPKTVYIFSNRQVSDKNDDFNKGSAVSYSFFVWEKGFRGDPSIKWIQSVK